MYNLKVNIFVITGPSGSGKSHLIHEIITLGIYPLEVYTDREKRPSESKISDRVHLSLEEFSYSLEEFLYWFEFQGNRYGYKKKDIKKQKKLGNSVCFNIPPVFLSEILSRLPEAIVIYLNVREKHFPMLYTRMLKRDLYRNIDKHKEKVIKSKIERRLEHARNELGLLETLKKLISNNPSSRVFDIYDDKILYKEVLPHIKKLI